MSSPGYFRKQEIAAERRRRKAWQRDYDAGYKAGIEGSPIPDDASRSWLLGHRDALDDAAGKDGMEGSA